MSDQFDVFISYKREEQNLAKDALEALQSAGYSAVSDIDIPPSKHFGDVIDDLIEAARVVVVLWTEKSAASDWVRGEAIDAFDQDKYLGILVEPMPEARLPRRVRHVQYVDFTGVDPGELAGAVLTEVEKRLGPPANSPEAAAEVSSVALQESTDFSIAVDLDTIEGFEGFLGRYEQSRYSDEAEARLKQLKGTVEGVRRVAPLTTLAFSAAALVLGVWTAVLGYYQFIAPPPDPDERVVILQQENKKLAGDLSDLQKAHNGLQDNHSDLTAKVNTLTASEKQLKERESARVSEKKALDAKLSDLTGQLNTATAALASKTEQSRENLDARTKLANQLSDLQAKYNTLAAGQTVQQVQKSTEKTEEPKAVAASPPKPNKPVKMLPDCRDEGKLGITIGGKCVDLNAKRLDLSKSDITDLSPLAGLTALQSLNLSNTQVADLSPLKGLTALKKLWLIRTQVSDLSPLTGLTTLEWLIIHDTPVENLSPLSKLTSLQELGAHNTFVTDLSPLTGLITLEGLYAAQMQVADISPLSELTTIQRLNLTNTHVTDFSSLSGLRQLFQLFLPNGLELGAFPKTDEGHKEVQDFLSTL